MNKAVKILLERLGLVEDQLTQTLPEVCECCGFTHTSERIVKTRLTLQREVFEINQALELIHEAEKASET